VLCTHEQFLKLSVGLGSLFHQLTESGGKDVLPFTSGLHYHYPNDGIS